MKKINWLKHLFFILPFLTLLMISLFLMYHAQFITELYAHHFEKQLLWFGIGLFLIILFQFIHSDFLFRFSKVFYWISVLLLVLVLVLGKDANGARAWIDFHFFSFQPSELMKLTYSLYLSQLVSQKKFYKWSDELKFILFVFVLFAIPSVLVFLEPDTGAILFYFFITIVLLWNSKINRRWFLLFGVIVCSLLGAFFYCYFFQKDLLIQLIGTTFFYRVERLFSFRSGMQIENALIAIGSAPLWKFSLTEVGIYIPESPTDFVFALSSNVFGIMGCVLILVSFLLLDFYFIHFVRSLKKKEHRLFGYSFLSIFISSQIINISMNLGIFPIIGIPLPFVSYGGSSTIVLFLYLALLFSFQKSGKKRKARVRD